MYSEKSKADDVQFILDLIAKIGAEIPEADMNNVNIAGKILGFVWVWRELFQHFQAQAMGQLWLIRFSSTLGLTDHSKGDYL